MALTVPRLGPLLNNNQTGQANKHLPLHDPGEGPQTQRTVRKSSGASGERRRQEASRRSAKDTETVEEDLLRVVPPRPGRFGACRLSLQPKKIANEHSAFFTLLFILLRVFKSLVDQQPFSSRDACFPGDLQVPEPRVAV